MKYAIENTSGQWWTGSCWGVKEVREEYTFFNLPEALPVSNLDGTITELISDELSDHYDAYYSDMRVESGNDLVASVRDVA